MSQEELSDPRKIIVLFARVEVPLPHFPSAPAQEDWLTVGWHGRHLSFAAGALAQPAGLQGGAERRACRTWVPPRSMDGLQGKRRKLFYEEKGGSIYETKLVFSQICAC